MNLVIMISYKIVGYNIVKFIAVYFFNLEKFFYIRYRIIFF